MKQAHESRESLDFVAEKIFLEQAEKWAEAAYHTEVNCHYFDTTITEAQLRASRVNNQDLSK